MPPKKASPNSRDKLNIPNSDTNHSSAVTDTDNEDFSNVSIRPRARKRQHDDDVSALMLEMRKSFEILKNQQNTIQESIKDIQSQNSDIIKSMDFISKQYEDMKDRLIKLESEKLSHLSYIQSLEIKVENLERSQKQTCIEIRNLPVQNNESKKDLLSVVKNIGAVTNIHIEDSHLSDIFRLSKKNGANKPIIANFSSILIKDKILAAVKAYNRNKNKLNTLHLKLEGEPKPVYISECLTDKTRKIFYSAREFSKKHGYKFCWTAHGKVFLRKSIGAQCHRIDTDKDLDYLLSSPSHKL